MTNRKLINYLAMGLLLTTLSLMSGGVQAQPRTASVQETDDKVKVDLYTRFVDTYKTDKAVAYATAKDYLQRYAKENDQYSQYVQLWVAYFEKGERLKQLRRLVYDDRNFAEAFKVGKQVMAEEPNHLDSLVALGNAGYLAANARNENFNTEALSYAQKAIQMLESGKTPETWDPFKGKSDTLAYLYSTVGLLKLKSAPDEAIDAILKTASLDSDLKKLPTLYYYLARAYETGPYAKLSADYQKNFAGKPETPESKQAIEKLNQVIDRIIDAYARAVAAAGTDPQQAANKTTWLTNLTNFYKFRHQDSDAGLNEFIAGALTRPLLAKP
jgi:tetratricopeptide (TPR) repeat protein